MLEGVDDRNRGGLSSLKVGGVDDGGRGVDGRETDFVIHVTVVLDGGATLVSLPPLTAQNQPAPDGGVALVSSPPLVAQNQPVPNDGVDFLVTMVCVDIMRLFGG